MSDRRIFLAGRTYSGTLVEVWAGPGSHPSRFEVRINGELVQVTGGSRQRDGGTTYIDTTQGRIIAHRRLGAEHYDEFAGARLYDELAKSDA